MIESEIDFTVPQGTFTLTRMPVRSGDTLRAWDAADEYVLNHLHERFEAHPLPARALVVNDSFGALAVALAAQGIEWVGSWSDSSLSRQGLEQNLAANSLSGAAASIPSTEDPGDAIDLAVIKVPKSNAQLEDQLCRLRPALSARSVVVAAGMAKHIHTSTTDLFERIIGPTTTSRATKKARLVFGEFDPDLVAPPSPWPRTWNHRDRPVVNHAGVFSAAKLDVGTRFLLDHLPLPDATLAAGSVVDLGCGNGVVGLSMAVRYPEAEVTFVDESYGAVASAEATFRASFPERSARFAVASDLRDVAEPRSADIVLINPPFHQNQALGDAVAWEMFQQARDALKSRGEVRVVGNRHLGYHVKLKRIFGNCQTVAGNNKFVVLRATRD